MAFPTDIGATTYYGEAYNNLATTLSQICGVSDATVYVASTTNYPSIGWITIEDEIRSYTGKTSGSFTGCTPGADNTTAAEHAAGKAVSLTLPAVMWTRAIADLRAALTKVGADSSAVNTTHDYKLSGVTGSDKAVSKTGTETLTNKIITSPLFTGTLDGWVATGDSWAYASAATITVPAGAASKYSVGMKVKLTQTTAKYFYISAVADTVLTVNGAGLYTVADAAITLPFYSSVNIPLGFPIKMIPGYIKSSVYLGTDMTGIVSVTHTKVTLDTENYDTGSDFASNKFTAPVSGYYRISGGIQYASTNVADGKRFFVTIYIDNSLYRQATVHSGAAANALYSTISFEMYLAKDSYVELFSYHDNGTNNIVVEGTEKTFLDISLISIL